MRRDENCVRVLRNGAHGRIRRCAAEEAMASHGYIARAPARHIQLPIFVLSQIPIQGPRVSEVGGGAGVLGRARVLVRSTSDVRSELRPDTCRTKTGCLMYLGSMNLY